FYHRNLHSFPTRRSSDLKIKGCSMVVNKENKQTVFISWFLIVLISALPDIILREVFKGNPPWLPLAKTGLLLVLFIISIFYNKLDRKSTRLNSSHVKISY